MSRHPLDLLLTPEEVSLLRDHDYEVEQEGGVQRVKPPAAGTWYRKRAHVRREVRFVRERPEEALAVAAMVLMGGEALRVAFRTWRRAIDGYVPLPEDGLLGENG